MTREQLTKRVDSIIKDTERLEDAVRDMGVTNIDRYPKEYGMLAAGAARRAEWLTCRLRRLIYETTTMRKPEYLLLAAEAQGIRFDDRDGVFEITLPGIALDHSKRRPSEFLFDPLCFAMGEYLRGHPIPRYRRCVVCYVLVFDRALPGRSCLDINSPDLKLYQDVAASYLLIDDSPRYIDVFHSAEPGNRNAVRMSFMECGRFPQWLREREQSREKTGA